MHKKIIFLLLATTLFFGCSKPIVPSDNSDKIPNLNPASVPSPVVPAPDPVPIPNPVVPPVPSPVVPVPVPSPVVPPSPAPSTEDARKKCTSSSQCEELSFFCIAETADASFGFCTDYKKLGNGCGWIELIDDQATQLCIDNK